MSNNNIERFNDAASTWDDNQQRLMLAKQIAERMMQEVSVDTSTNILDYGCGTGLVSLELAKLAGHVTCVDSSSGMLEALNQKIHKDQIANIDTVECEYTSPLFKKLGLFDVVVSSMTMHHIENSEQFLSALYDMTLPGGRVLIADLDKEDGSFHPDPTGVHHHGFSRNQFIETLTKAGFVEVSITAVLTMKKDTPAGPSDFDVLLAVGMKPK